MHGGNRQLPRRGQRVEYENKQAKNEGECHVKQVRRLLNWLWIEEVLVHAAQCEEDWLENGQNGIQCFENAFVCLVEFYL